MLELTLQSFIINPSQKNEKNQIHKHKILKLYYYEFDLSHNYYLPLQSKIKHNYFH